MEIGMWYWLILVIWFLFYGWGTLDVTERGRYGRIGSGVVLFVLLVLIGFKTMGDLIK